MTGAVGPVASGDEAYLERDEGAGAMPPDVAAVFAGFSVEVRSRLEAVRALIFQVADEAGVGPLTETLKWGQPAYLTQATCAGSTVRLGVKDGRPVVFFICTSGLVDGFREDFPELPYLGQRGLLLEDALDEGALALCLRRALTYHRGKRTGRG
ncbi:MAG: DUF1801 domain-containing protein [Paracoccaceae bacterium]